MKASGTRKFRFSWSTFSSRAMSVPAAPYWPSLTRRSVAGPRSTQRVLADEALLEQVLGALQALAVELRLRRARGEHRREFRLIELHQHRAARNALAFVETEFGDAPRDFRPDRHRFVGPQRA